VFEEDYEFALCLTHDVDRVYQTYQPFYYGIRNQNLRRIQDIWSDKNPYWQFEDIMKLEDDLGVRSSFYFLNEQHLFSDRPFRELFSPKAWKLYIGRYDIESKDIRDIIQELDLGGWEVGLHGSYNSYDNLDILRNEKVTLEKLSKSSIIGGRQHYLNRNTPETWEIQRSIGLKYDSSLGSSETFGFQHGYLPLYPFNDNFIVFPLTLMETTVMRGRDYQNAKKICFDLLDEAQSNDAIMTVLWHPRFFCEDVYPGYKSLYIELIEEALNMGAWVGDCRSCYEKLGKFDD